jgi:hypothetical protein
MTQRRAAGPWRRRLVLLLVLGALAGTAWWQRDTLADTYDDVVERIEGAAPASGLDGPATADAAAVELSPGS